MKIDIEKPIPKYLQLQDILEQHFKHQQYEKHQRIPSEWELMQQFDVSRNTVRRALEELADAGIIYKKQGSGSYFSGKTRLSAKEGLLFGVIVPISTQISPHIIRGITDITHQKNANIMLASSNADPQKELAWLEQLLQQDIDGLLFEPAGGFQHFEESKNFQLLKDLNVPVVFMDWMIEDPEVYYVSLNDREGGFRATSYLARAGHRRIACVYPRDHLPGLQRYEGYRKALEAFRIPYTQDFDKSATIFAWNASDYAYTATKELLESGGANPSAIVYFDDNAALRGYSAIRETGLKIPDDISVIGFDDSELAVVADVPLTSMTNPRYQIGKWAAEMLFDVIEQKQRRTSWQIQIYPAVTIRDSVRIMQ